MATLDYNEMCALAWLFEDWAFNNPTLNGDRRTRFLQMAVDYERIADFCGEGWKASDDDSPPGVIAFIARRTLSRRTEGSFSE